MWRESGRKGRLRDAQEGDRARKERRLLKPVLSFHRRPIEQIGLISRKLSKRHWLILSIAVFDLVYCPGLQLAVTSMND